MKTLKKRVIGIVLSLTLICTSIGINPVPTKAQDFSQFFVYKSYSEALDKEYYDEVIKTVGNYEAQINGNTYQNYALTEAKGGSATGKYGITSTDAFINGSATGGYQGTSKSDIQSMVVDFHRVRNISIIQLSWETASAEKYGIDFSLDGENWTTVAYVEKNSKTGKRCDEIDLSVGQNTRFVRVQCLKRQTGYAYNLYEVGAFSATRKADGVEPVAAYTYTSSEQNLINSQKVEQESESESIAEWESVQSEYSKYVNTDTNIAKDSAKYTSSYFNGEGSLEALTDGNTKTQGTTAKISSTNDCEYFVMDLGKEYTTSDIDKIFINYVANSGTWGVDGFSLYCSKEIDITTKEFNYGTDEAPKNKEIIDADNTQWNLLLKESPSKCNYQNYYEQFSSSYEDSFRYIKLEYKYASKERTWGIQINEFALYKPVPEEPTTEETTTEVPTEPVTLKPVTESNYVEKDTPISNVSYKYAYNDAGYAAGTISVSSASDERYSLYWGEGNETDGYKALTKNNIPYTELGTVTTSGGKGEFKIISNYTAIPENAQNLLVFNDKNQLDYIYDIPESKQFNKGNSTYTFASLGDQHFNRYIKNGVDPAVESFDTALKFIQNQGIKFVAGVGDISALAEESAFRKYREALGDYSDLTVLTCIGNHDCIKNNNEDEDGNTYFKKYVNQSAYTYKSDSEDVQKSQGILNTGSNEMDLVYSPVGTDNIFLFLNQNEDATNDYTTSENILTSTQLDWLDEQLTKYSDKNVFLYFHTYLSTDSKSTTSCVGNLINEGNVFYNLTYNPSAADGERLRSIINKYNNLTVVNGHSHWLYGMQMFNKNLNIGTTSGTDFKKGATIVHVSSVTSPRYVGVTDKDRTDLPGQASEGTFTDVYSTANVYTGVDFKNGQYESYATYIQSTDGSVPQIASEEPEKKDISAGEISLVNGSEYTYNRAGITPSIKVILDNVELDSSSYTVSYTNNVNAGEGQITVTGKGDYIGELKKEFTILPKNLNDTDIEIDTKNLNTQFEFDGKDRTPIIFIKYKNVQLAVMFDYLTDYYNNFYPGQASIKIRGTGNYTGELTKYFKIVKIAMANVTTKAYFSGTKLIATANNGSYAMTYGTDYKYSAVTDASGNVKVTFTGLGTKYYGTYAITISAEDNPNKPAPTTTPKPVTLSKPSINKIKNLKAKKVQLKWKKKSNISGYIIRYSTSKKMKKATKKTVKANKITYTVKKLKKKKTYYFQILTYLVKNGKTYYSKWSSVKKIKIKK